VTHCHFLLLPIGGFLFILNCINSVTVEEIKKSVSEAGRFLNFAGDDSLWFFIGRGVGEGVVGGVVAHPAADEGDGQDGCAADY
jgi:hypothetical protein